MSLPVLYSFRRCPYAMRARLALSQSQVPVALREVALRDKPPAFLEVSPSQTVPCLVAGETVIDESLDIMVWALRQNDPGNWLNMPQDGWAWIARCDGPFKHALDRTKYATRYPSEDPLHHRARGAAFISDLNEQLDGQIFRTPTVADFAILPFVRQFAFIDKNWFDAQPWPRAQAWLERFLAGRPFSDIMPKYRPWREGDAAVIFPETSDETLRECVDLAARPA